MNQLTSEEKHIIEDKGTEAPFSGEYDNFYEPGTFICRKCNTPLFTSKAKFDAGCGWPAFDDAFPDAIKRLEYAPLQGGTEIVCANCGGHLGHEFKNEGFTKTDTRHCVNSLSITFIPESQNLPRVLNQ